MKPLLSQLRDLGRLVAWAFACGIVSASFGALLATLFETGFGLLAVAILVVWGVFSLVPMLLLTSFIVLDVVYFFSANAVAMMPAVTKWASEDTPHDYESSTEKTLTYLALLTNPLMPLVAVAGLFLLKLPADKELVCQLLEGEDSNPVRRFLHAQRPFAPFVDGVISVSRTG